MARARSIKPSFFSNEVLSELSPHARLMFIGLWCLCDKDGKMEWRPKRVKAELFPYEDVDCTVLARCLQDAGFILVYDKDGVEYLKVFTFAKHQHIHRDEKSKGYPEPDVSTNVTPCNNGARTVQERCENASNLKSDILNLKDESLNIKSASAYELDIRFVTVKDEYLKIKDATVDADEAYKVWRQQGMATYASQILDAIHSHAKTEKFKSGYAPAFSKYLKSGTWKEVAKVPERVVTVKPDYAPF